MEPVATCDLAPSTSLWDTFHFLHHQLLCVTSEKTQDYYTIKYTFPFCHKVTKRIFRKKCQIIRALSTVQRLVLDMGSLLSYVFFLSRIQNACIVRDQVNKGSI